jgi:tetratricopeptide (TPR) repeat protein
MKSGMKSVTNLECTTVKPLVLIRKTCLLLAIAIGVLLLSPSLAEAQMPMHKHRFSMPLNQVIQSQVNAGLYTAERRRAEVKLTDALYEQDPVRAIALLEEAGRLDPTFDKPLTYACDAQRERRNYVAAAAACQQASNRLPNFGSYEMRLAEVQELANQPAQAAASFGRAEAIYRMNAAPDRADTAGANLARLRRSFKIP